MTGRNAVIPTIATRLKDRLRRRRHPGKLMIVPFLGYGTRSEVYVKGRVLRDKGITVAKDSDTLWTNLVNMYKRYTSVGIPGVLVRVRFGDIQQEILTNQTGYFELSFKPEIPLEANDIWYDISFELIDYPGKASNPGVNATLQAVGRALIPSPGAQFGVISDIDDTVLRTNMINIFRMVSNTFLNNARTRLPFEGVAAFYDALRLGTVEGAYNPIYYVSSSPWNLYDLMADFFVIRGIPTGPLFLVDVHISRGRIIAPGHHVHKMAVIQNLLDIYPHLRFILIGDSGQKDPEIYLEVVQKNLGRIQAIYIRDVTGKRRDKQVRAIISQVQTLGTEMLFVEDTLGASNHALECGYILPHKLPDIKQERDKDKQADKQAVEAKI